jgi:putative peptide zinc metalloprotease protein
MTDPTPVPEPPTVVSAGEPPTVVSPAPPTVESPLPSAAPVEAAMTPGAQEPPRLAAGMQLMGELEGSGFEETPFLLRRPDGQVVQLPQLLYLVAERLDGTRTWEQIASEVSAAFERELAPDDVRFLVDEKLAPLGILQGAPDAPEPEKDAGQDLLALTWKARVVPERAVYAITTVLRPLFLPPVVIAVVAGFFALDAWLLLSHGISQPLRGVLYQPALLVAMFGGVVLATAFHEIGHATATRYGGAKPGVMGVGIYVIWPVFYTDVTDAYRLGRGGRLRTDLGGVYFNAIFALAIAGIYALTGYEPLLVLVLVQTFAILQQLLPLGRLDGYLILTDLTGVPDMLTRMRPILRSLIPGRPADARVKELKPWVRVVTSGYMLLLIPVLLFAIVMMLLHAPRLFATAYDSFGVRWDQASNAFGDGHVATGLGGVLQMAALGLPVLGMVTTTMRVGGRVGAGAWAWSAGEPLRRALLVTAATGGTALAATTWWPNGEYRPIQPGERGTLAGAVQSISAIPSGRPALTPARQAELNGAGFRRDRLREERGAGFEDETTQEDTTTTETTETTTTETTPPTTDATTVPTTETVPTTTTPPTTDTTTTPLTP